MPEELARWAAARAPGLLARAEIEAVAVLRDALVGAAIAEPRSEPVFDPRPQRTPPHEAAELLWTYCVTSATEPMPAELTGVAGRPVERVETAGLAALTGHVPASEFAEEPLRRNLNDLAWVERVARAHEGVLDRAFAAGAIVPLRLCTIYESETSVRRMLEREHDGFADALDRLAGRQEWGVKLLVAPDRLADAAAARLDEEAVEDELATPMGGGAYMLRRRRERQVRGLVDALAVEVREQVHSRLADWALDAVTLPAQNRDLSGHEDEMLLNGAYLVEADRVDDLRALVTELEERHRALAARVVLSGPWPPHNFVGRSGAGPLA